MFIVRSSDQKYCYARMVYVLLCFPSTSFPNCFVNLFSDQKRFNVQMVPIVCCVLLFKQKTQLSMCFLSSFYFWSHNDVWFELFRYLCCLWSRTKILSKCSQSCFFLVPEIVYDHMIAFFVCVSDQDIVIFEWCQFCGASEAPKYDFQMLDSSWVSGPTKNSMFK